MSDFCLDDLARCREKINELDIRLVNLINERTRVVEEIGRIKQHLTLGIYEPKREEEVFENIRRHNPGPLPEDAIKRIFERIIDEMRTVQKIKMLERDNANK